MLLPNTILIADRCYQDCTTALLEPTIIFTRHAGAADSTDRRKPMRVSEIVEIIQRLWDRNGDVEVFVGDSDGAYYKPLLKYETAQPGHKGGRLVIEGDWEGDFEDDREGDDND